MREPEDLSGVDVELAPLMYKLIQKFNAIEGLLRFMINALLYPALLVRHDLRLDPFSVLSTTVASHLHFGHLQELAKRLYLVHFPGEEDSERFKETWASLGKASEHRNLIVHAIRTTEQQREFLTTMKKAKRGYSIVSTPASPKDLQDRIREVEAAWHKLAWLIPDAMERLEVESVVARAARGDGEIEQGDMPPVAYRS